MLVKGLSYDTFRTNAVPTVFLAVIVAEIVVAPAATVEINPELFIVAVAPVVDAYVIPEFGGVKT